VDKIIPTMLLKVYVPSVSSSGNVMEKSVYFERSNSARTFVAVKLMRLNGMLTVESQ